jgi:hypothetical protein
MDAVVNRMTVATLKEVVRQNKLGKITKMRRPELEEMVLTLPYSTVQPYLERQDTNKRLKEDRRLTDKLEEHNDNLECMSEFRVGDKVFWRKTEAGTSGNYEFGIIDKLVNGKAVISRVYVDRKVTGSVGADFIFTIQPTWTDVRGTITMPCRDIQKDDGKVKNVRTYE